MALSLFPCARRSLLLLAVFGSMVAISLSTADAQDPKIEPGFVSLFDGKTFNGWKKAEENQDAWKIVDGKLMCEGDRCHLFYDGPLAPMKDLHFKAEVMTTPGSNAGIYFHTKFQDQGWPKYGFECQVNVSHNDPKKTSSLYGVKNVDAATLKELGVQDNQWYTQEIIVQGRHIQLIVNGKTLVDYTEPENKKAFDQTFERRLGQGTFGLQAHDPKSKVYFRNLRVKKLN